MTKTFRRHFLKSKEARKLLEELSEKTRIPAETILGENVKIEVLETEFAEVFIIGKKPLIARVKGKFVPTLVFEEALKHLPKLVVDMGAVPHICNGADVMAPGISSIEGEFDEGHVLVIVDEKHGKPLAIGSAMVNSERMRRASRGKVVENVHFIGDKLWRLLKKL